MSPPRPDPPNERDQLRGFMLTVVEFIDKKARLEGAPPFDGSLLEPIRNTRSLAGLRQAARDVVEWSQDFDASEVALIDGRLAADALPTLSQMRDRRYRTLVDALCRGRIRNDTEFRLVNAYVSEVDGTELSGDRLSRANGLLSDYEASRGVGQTE